MVKCINCNDTKTIQYPDELFERPCPVCYSEPQGTADTAGHKADATAYALSAALAKAKPAPLSDPLAGLVTQAWQHPEAKWVHVSRDTVANHCMKGGREPEPLILHSEAAKIIAEKVAKSEVDKAKLWLELAHMKERAEAAETELDKLKVQEPVGYVIKHPRFTDDFQKIPLTDGDKSNGYTEHPLYAAPVSDSLKVENERLREALTVARRAYDAATKPDSAFDHPKTLKYNDPIVVRLLNSGAALAPHEPDPNKVD